VAGDAAYAEGVNNLSINGIPLSDDPEIPPPSQPGYAKGDFDGWVTQVTVTDGAITIAARTGAITPKLCCVEIGPRNVVTDLTTVAPALVARVASMTSATVGGGNAALARQPRSYVVTPTYVDEVLGYVTGRGPEAQRYYAHANHLYSVAALTDAAGQVVERYSYNAYGKRTILAADGTTVRTTSSYGNQIGFTGRYHDEETGLVYGRGRMYSPTLGRWTSRDPWQFLDHVNVADLGALMSRPGMAGIPLHGGTLDGRIHLDTPTPRSGDGYHDGYNLYAAYFVPGSVDPSGEGTCAPAEIAKCAANCAAKYATKGLTANRCETLWYTCWLVAACDCDCTGVLIGSAVVGGVTECWYNFGVVPKTGLARVGVCPPTWISPA